MVNTRSRGGAPSIRAAAVAGGLATYAMDVTGGRVVAPALDMKPPSGLGRWIGHMFRGRFTHRDPRVPTFALCTHVAYGVGLGAGLRLGDLAVRLIPLRGSP